MIQMPESVAKTSTLQGNTQQCSSCGRMTSADKLAWIDEKSIRGN